MASLYSDENNSAAVHWPNSPGENREAHFHALPHLSFTVLGAGSRGKVTRAPMISFHLRILHICAEESTADSFS